jgi:hypothetical protein
MLVPVRAGNGLERHVGDEERARLEDVRRDGKGFMLLLTTKEAPQLGIAAATELLRGALGSRAGG